MGWLFGGRSSGKDKARQKQIVEQSIQAHYNNRPLQISSNAAASAPTSASLATAGSYSAVAPPLGAQLGLSYHQLNQYNMSQQQQLQPDDVIMNIHDRADNEDTSMMANERTNDNKSSKSHKQREVYVDPDDNDDRYSKDGTEQPIMPSNHHHHPSSGRHHNDVPEARQNHLNSLFNGHLMKWKFEAEEGSAFIRVPAFFGALALMTTAIVALVLYPDAWTSHSIVMSVGVIIMSVFILILDGRFLATNPLSARAHLRNVMTRNFNIFRYLWGRALLYIVAGTLNVAQWFLITICSGAFLIFVGVVALFVGIHASRKFSALRNSLADESYLLLVFSNYDHDGDGCLAPHEFALLLADLGMELDDRYTLKAFNVIDCDNDRKISFEEFNHWWASGYIERGRKRWSEHEDYRRMD